MASTFNEDLRLAAQILLVETAQSFVGVHESGSDNHGPEVEKFQAAVDGKAQGEPWCLCFVMYCVAHVEAALPIKSRLFRTEHCLTAWNRTPEDLRVPDAERGAIVLWQRQSSFAGHAGIVVGKRSPEVFLTVEGNTTDGKDIEREGDGVFQKYRRLHGNGIFRRLGFIQPF